MKGLISIVTLLSVTLVHVHASDFGYQYSYSCWRDCGYYKSSEFTLCSKYQWDYCWVPSRRTIMIIVLITGIISTIVILWCCLRRCKRRQAKARPTSPPPGSMCIWQA